VRAFDIQDGTGAADAPEGHGGVLGDALAWLGAHEALLWWLVVASIASLVLCAAFLPVVLVRLPVDYFSPHRPHAPWPRTLLGWLTRIASNVAGVVFVCAGVAMLVLPGQGLLTIFVGLLLLEFPGKRRLERGIVARPAIRRFVDRIRGRRGRPPFDLG
jgi:hypothetical protein